MSEISTKIPGLKIRMAARQDTGLILTLIRELADYEGMLSEVVADKGTLEHWLFDREKAEVLIAEMEGQPAGFALFFHNFSTFLCRAGLYLEDLYVRPFARGKGLGKEFMRCLASIALERGCGRMEWWCLDWNKPSIDFYLAMGAEPMSDWTVYRLDQDAMEKLREQG